MPVFSVDTYNTTCSNCLRTFEEGQLNRVENIDGLICNDCINEFFYKCADCGKIIASRDVFRSMRGIIRCRDCYDRAVIPADNKCSGCHCVSDNLIEINDGEFSRLCDECAGAITSICPNCQTRRLNCRMVDVHSGYDSELYCTHCVPDGYYRCNACESYYHESSMTEFDGYLYCNSCYDDLRDNYECRDEDYENIHEYHYKPEQMFYSIDGVSENSTDDEIFMGVELETDGYDCWESRNETAEQLLRFSHNEMLFHLEEDGSLCMGFELVTRPFTLAYHKKVFCWDRICHTITYGSGREMSNCGMHIHFNKRFFSDNVELHTLKLLYIYEMFWDKFVKFSGRTHAGSIEHYAARYNMDFSVKCSTEIPTKIRDARSKGRYFAVNIENKNTIEFRIFASPLNYRRIYANLEMCDYLIRTTKKLSIKQVQKLTWYKFTKNISKRKYPNLIKYLEKLELIKGDE